MGRFYPGVIGSLSGKFGAIVIRSMNHKNFYSLRPAKYKKCINTSALKTRSNFSAAAHLAKFLSNIPLINSVWSASSISGVSAYHKILKTNIQFVQDGLLTKNNIIVSRSIYSLQLNASIVNSQLKITFGNSGTNLIPIFSNKSILQIVFLLCNPNGSSINNYSLKNYSIRIKDISFEQGSELLIAIPPNLLPLILDAHQRIVFLSFISVLENNSSPLNTFSPSIIL